jgi:hypothetical protein
MRSRTLGQNSAHQSNGRRVRNCAMAYFIIASLAGSAGRFISGKGYNEKEVERFKLKSLFNF